jgi:hypothetical protein
LLQSKGINLEREHANLEADRRATQLEEQIPDVAMTISRQQLQPFQGNRQRCNRENDQHQAARIGPSKEYGEHDVRSKTIHVGFAVDEFGSEFDWTERKVDNAG